MHILNEHEKGCKMKDCYFLFQNSKDKSDQFIVKAFNDAAAIAEVDIKKGYNNTYIMTGQTYTSLYQARSQNNFKLYIL